MKSKLVAGVITLAILTLLALSGPAEAFIVSLNISNPTVYPGETIIFTISADAEINDTNPGYFSLDLIGSTNYTCKFDINETILEGCNGMIIEKLNEEYGYGYNLLKNVKFRIDLNSSGYATGKYKTFVKVVSENKTSSKQGITINIKPSRNGMIDCSIRGKEGNLTVNGTSLGTNNKINFFVPLENAVKGKGYLTGQKGKNRFSYNFDVLEVINNSADEARILVSGDYKIGLSKDVKEDAVIIVIKSGTVSAVGEDINLQNMKITFRKGC